jgi:hypothetical protein
MLYFKHITSNGTGIKILQDLQFTMWMVSVFNNTCLPVTEQKVIHESLQSFTMVVQRI